MLQAHPDSAIALNLKACNQFRLYDGKAAEAELAPLTKEAVSVDKIESDLVRHNMVVFQQGERALQVAGGRSGRGRVGLGLTRLEEACRGGGSGCWMTRASPQPPSLTRAHAGSRRLTQEPPRRVARYCRRWWARCRRRASTW